MTTHLQLPLALLAVASLSRTALAEPVVMTSLPGDESGRIDTTEADDDRSTLRVVGRAALYVPRLVLELAMKPLEGAVWAFQRYQLPARLHRLFWNDANTLALIPTVSLEAGFGANVGAHLVYRDIFGAGERLDLRASTGGRYRSRLVARTRSGERLGRHAALQSTFEYEQRPKDPFYGYGNADAAGAGTESRFRHRLARGITELDVRLGAFRIQPSMAIADHAFSAAATDMTSGIAGFAGHRTGYAELQLAWDTRRAWDTNEPASIPSTGWLVAAFAGRARALDDTHPDFWRYGGQIQRFVHLAEGPRTLVLRLHGEAVTGALDEVPFDELPRLGGKDRLRGYAADRFRDRLALSGAVDYRWDLSREFAATVFVDAGRVYRDPADVTLDDLRVGYGVSLEALSEKSFLARVSLASSIDGGWFVDFALDPVFDLDRRVQRK